MIAQQRPCLLQALFLFFFGRDCISQVQRYQPQEYVKSTTSRKTVLDAGVHASCIGAYMVTLAVVLALHGDTHMS